MLFLDFFQNEFLFFLNFKIQNSFNFMLLLLFLSFFLDIVTFYITFYFFFLMYISPILINFVLFVLFQYDSRLFEDELKNEK